MATTVYLPNPSVLIGSVDVSDQCSAATLEVGYESRDITTLNDTGRKFTKTLQTVNLTLTMFDSLGTAEVEATLFDIVGDGTTTVTILPSGSTPGTTNPEYTLTNTMLGTFTPINASVGELATVNVTFTGGTWARSLT